MSSNMIEPPRFTMADVTVHRKERLFHKHFAIDEYVVSYKTFKGGQTCPLVREIFERDQDAVAILPYDPVSDEVVFIEQFRPGALKDPVSPWLIEIVAGMIDEGETPLEAARRELAEEAHLHCQPQNFYYVNAVYPSPGGASERVIIYVAIVDASHLDKLGGLESENEDLRIFKVKAADAFDMLKTCRLNNAAAIIGVGYLLQNYESIKQKHVQ